MEKILPENNGETSYNISLATYIIFGRRIYFMCNTVMKKVILTLVMVFVFFTAISAISANQVMSESFTIVTTFTILEDYARNIAGEDGDVRVISPIGAEVHEWELTPRNFVDLEEADIVFYNGLNVEQWMGQVRAVVRPGVPIIAVGEVCGYPTLPIVTGDYVGDPDPHIWMDPRGAASYVEAMRDFLIEYDPVRSAIYEENAQKYLDSLEDLYYELFHMVSVIPEENRTLITSEAAFIYFANAYGFYHDAIWGTNTEEEGTPQQMIRIIRIIEEKKPVGIFWESTGSDRYALSVSADTKVPVFGPLYVDSVDKGDTDTATYIEMMRANMSLLMEVLID